MLNLQIQERSEAHKGIMAKDQEYAAMVKRQVYTTIYIYIAGRTRKEGPREERAKRAST